MPKPVNIRYIVNDVDEAIEFYTKMLHLKVEMHQVGEFNIVKKESAVIAQQANWNLASSSPFQYLPAL
jgi:catechol 2,3-dioxygenase-like lactoylglutathione lyase family enzyme